MEKCGAGIKYNRECRDRNHQYIAGKKVVNLLDLEQYILNLPPLQLYGVIECFEVLYSGN